MIQHKFYGGHDVTIVPIFDVHLGAEECMEEEFEQFIQTVKDRDHVYVVLGGDLIDNGLKNSLTNVYRQKYMPSEQKRRMAKLLEPIRDRILCSVSGNHESRSARECDDSVTYDIMSKLDLEHLCRENLAFVKIKLGKEHTRNGAVTDGTRRPTYVLVVTHGAGGGMLTGGAVNRGERYGYVVDGMDALIVGHTHPLNGLLQNCRPYSSPDMCSGRLPEQSHSAAEEHPTRRRWTAYRPSGTRRRQAGQTPPPSSSQVPLRWPAQRSLRPRQTGRDLDCSSATSLGFLQKKLLPHALKPLQVLLLLLPEIHIDAEQVVNKQEIVVITVQESHPLSVKSV